MVAQGITLFQGAIMPSNPTHTTRRRFLASFLSLAAAPAKGFSLFGKKKVSNLGKVYEYLKDGHLRARELGSQRISVKNADFTHVEIQDTSWQYFDFVNCDFAGTFSIRLEWLTESTFTNCNFSGILELGNARDVRFINCTVAVNGIGGINFFRNSTSLVFEGCTFRNSGYDLNHEGGVTSEGEILFIDCKAQGFVQGADKKLTLRNCATRSVRLATAPYGLYVNDLSKLPYADFLLEDCDFTFGVRATNLSLNSLTMRNCKVDVFKTAGSVVRGDVLVEGIKEGFLRLSASNFQGKFTVRNCSFYDTEEGHSFKCNTDTPRYSLIENVQCGQAPADVICSGGPMKESDWLPVASNKSTIIRDCDIPHLHVDWAQT
ncbi:MAG: right-handed parallel beta-helix repeat-containing protein, partial [Zoogloeaceae bacterium]|nr:right-handed parallel beta-helix repeat-containing protein [Zoogloeaceae bacterium]